MIDRHARNEVILAIDAFLDREFMAFEFDGRLQSIESVDQTVNWVIHELWKHYDDCTDHFECFGRRDWQYLQRLKLLLASDLEIRRQDASYRWGAGIAAVLTLGGVVMLLLFADPWKAIPAALFLSSFIAWWISLQGNRSGTWETTATPESFPFHSFAELRAVRTEIPCFRRKAFPNRSVVGTRWESAGFRSGLAFVLWFFYSPVVLLLQVLQPFRRRLVVLAKP